jgi:exopolysaccharide biosynthesis polyprenyl glycosylphosphotransferase
MNHHEYGINLVGFVDDTPKERREDLGTLALLGSPAELPEIVRLLDVERVIFAFSRESHDADLRLIRALDDLGVQIDIIPRLFEIVTPTAEVHMVEGLPVMSLRSVRLSRSSQALKRVLDLTVAGLALVVLAPLFAFIAWWIWRDSDGPVFFRQTRLGHNMREFTVLKFRTMRNGTSSAEHELYIRQSLTGTRAPESDGLFKLERRDVITRPGRWLRRTSLDELPQLINVLRGDMSLVGPRPCLLYETEGFLPHHFERFAVPAGMTGLWQVMARARSTFREALDMDVTYVRSWSLGLDLRLLFRTPLQLLRPKGTR